MTSSDETFLAIVEASWSESEIVELLAVSEVFRLAALLAAAENN